MLLKYYNKKGGENMNIDFFSKTDIESDISSIEKIISTNIFSNQSIGNPFVKAAFIEVLICLRDLMYKSGKYATRINFKDDVLISDQIKDVTDLIKFVRDALCHPELPHHFVIPDQVKATFNISFGKCNLMSIGDIIISSDYEDDVCFFFGQQRIYLKRHIIRALNEAKSKLLPLL